ncbi:MAG: TIGR03936 family radical SAM-associated protein [Oscillospiraceae bacterium]|jgi:radical SAM-linked protein|nr:TIGR03936 family radical SAM-associated protein [Oscillospiraceae bacterium]
METVRVWFRKRGKVKFISHLDVQRCVLRAVKCTKIPVWYTQGFNPHVFITFALPLPLGVEGERESFDIKLLEPQNLESIANAMNRWLPKGLEISSVGNPMMSPNLVRYACFSIKIFPQKTEQCPNLNELQKSIEDVFSHPNLMVEKETKSGNKQIDLKKEIKSHSFIHCKEFSKLTAIMPAGNERNISPNLLIKALKKFFFFPFSYSIVRTGLFTEKMEAFY